MWALVYMDPRSLRYEQIPKPIPGPGEVLVAVKAVGVCGSRVHWYLGITGRQIPPMVMGHEFSGESGRVGSRCGGRGGWDQGGRPALSLCGKCGQCRQGHTHFCVQAKFLGVLTRHGTMAEYVVVPAKRLFPLPEGLGFAEGALVEPAAVALRAISKLGERPMPERVAIVGAGPIGLLLLPIREAARSQGSADDRLEDYPLEHWPKS